MNFEFQPIDKRNILENRFVFFYLFYLCKFVNTIHSYLNLTIPYNSIGNIDENSLNYIYTIVNLAKELAKHNGNSDFNFP